MHTTQTRDLLAEMRIFLSIDQWFLNAVPRGLPYRAAKRQCCTVVNIKRRLFHGFAEQRSADQRWADCHILRSRSSHDFLKLTSSPTTVQKFFKCKAKSKWSPENWKNPQQKCRISFPLTQSKSCPDHKFWSALHSGSNPNSKKFAIDRIQSNPSPAQCSSLLRTHTCTPQSSENLIVTKVSLWKINNDQDHNRLQLEKSKVSPVVLRWLVRIWISLDWRWTDAKTAMCVCGQKLPNEAMVPAKLRRHVITNHSNLQTETMVYF